MCAQQILPGGSIFILSDSLDVREATLMGRGMAPVAWLTGAIVLSTYTEGQVCQVNSY